MPRPQTVRGPSMFGEAAQDEHAETHLSPLVEASCSSAQPTSSLDRQGTQHLYGWHDDGATEPEKSIPGREVLNDKSKEKLRRLSKDKKAAREQVTV